MSSKLAAAMAGTNSAVAQERSPYVVFRNQIEKLRPEIATLVGKENVDRFLRVCLNAVQSTPKVLEADRKSLLIAAMRAAQDHLLPDGREAVFNIYSTKQKIDGVERWVDVVQYLPMVGGLIKKLYDSGHVIFVDAVAVWEKDHFKYQRGDDPKIEHVPYDGEGDAGKLKAAYVIMKLKNGETKREVMFRRDIEPIKAKSKAAKGLMWTDFEDQAWIKTVIKRAYKQVPSSIEIERAIAADNEATGIEGIETAVGSTGSTELAALVDGRLDHELRKVPPGKVETKETAATPEKPKETAATTAAASADAVAGSAPEKREGTPEDRDAIIAKLKAATTIDALGEEADKANQFTWTVPDLGAINAVYHECVAALST